MKQEEIRALEAVEMELSDMAERLIALHEYLTENVNFERDTNEQITHNSK